MCVCVRFFFQTGLNSSKGKPNMQLYAKLLVAASFLLRINMFASSNPAWVAADIPDLERLGGRYLRKLLLKWQRLWANALLLQMVVIWESFNLESLTQPLIEACPAIPAALFWPDGCWEWWETPWNSTPTNKRLFASYVCSVGMYYCDCPLLAT